jgi:hypothetical protein
MNPLQNKEEKTIWHEQHETNRKSGLTRVFRKGKQFLLTSGLRRDTNIP